MRGATTVTARRHHPPGVIPRRLLELVPLPLSTVASGAATTAAAPFPCFPLSCRARLPYLVPDDNFLLSREHVWAVVLRTGGTASQRDSTGLGRENL